MYQQSDLLQRNLRRERREQLRRVRADLPEWAALLWRHVRGMPESEHGLLQLRRLWQCLRGRANLLRRVVRGQQREQLRRVRTGLLECRGVRRARVPLHLHE
jgi:hypothetical protein